MNASVHTRPQRLCLPVLVVIAAASMLAGCGSERVQRELVRIPYKDFGYTPQRVTLGGGFFVEAETFHAALLKSYRRQQYAARTCDRSDADALSRAVDLAWHHMQWSRVNLYARLCAPDDTAAQRVFSQAAFNMLAALKNSGVAVHDQNLDRIRSGALPGGIDTLAQEIIVRQSAGESLSPAGVIYLFTLSRFIVCYMLGDVSVDQWNEASLPDLAPSWSNALRALAMANVPAGESAELDAIKSAMFACAASGRQREAFVEYKRLDERFSRLFESLLSRLSTPIGENPPFDVRDFANKAEYLGAWADLLVENIISTMFRAPLAARSRLVAIIEAADRYTDWFCAAYMRHRMPAGTPEADELLERRTGRFLEAAASAGVALDDSSVALLRAGETSVDPVLHVYNDIRRSLGRNERTLFDETFYQLGFLKELALVRLAEWPRKDWVEYFGKKYVAYLVHTTPAITQQRCDELSAVYNELLAAAGSGDAYAIDALLYRYYQWCEASDRDLLRVLVADPAPAPTPPVPAGKH